MSDPGTVEIEQHLSGLAATGDAEIGHFGLCASKNTLDDTGDSIQCPSATGGTGSPSSKAGSGLGSLPQKSLSLQFSTANSVDDFDAGTDRTRRWSNSQPAETAPQLQFCVLPVPTNRYPSDMPADGSAAGGLQFCSLPMPTEKMPVKSSSEDLSPTKARKQPRRSLPSCALNVKSEALESAADIGLVQRIALILTSSTACSKVSARLFKKYAVATQTPEGEMMLLSLSSMPQVLESLKIPAEHHQIVQKVRRKQMNLERCPEQMNAETFEKILTKVLRRIRDTYCAHLSKNQFVTHNERKLEEDYMQLASCGAGNFGQCSWVVHKVTRKMRVVKKIPKENVEVPQEEIEQELVALTGLDHPNIVRLFEWFESESSFLLVMEAAHGGDLEKLLREALGNGCPGLAVKMVRSITEQALGALVYIHSQHVIHRDLKPANMILTQANTFPPHLLLADFGIADIFGSADVLSKGCIQSSKKGTWAYMAPEIFSDSVSPKSDLWALGVVIYELLCGKRPFGVKPFEVYANICCDDEPVDLSPLSKVQCRKEAVQLVSLLLTKDESRRPTAQEAEASFQSWPNDDAKKHEADTSSLRCSVQHSIHDFGGSSAIYKVALLCVASQLDTSTVEELNEVFVSMDLDHDGQLSVPEMVTAFSNQGYTEDQIDCMVDALDINSSGLVEYSEFIAGCLDVRKELIDSSLYHAFNVFDINRDGKITLDELRTIIMGGDNGTGFSDLLKDGETIDEEFSQMDTSKDGEISYAEFRAYMEQHRNCDGASVYEKKIQLETTGDIKRLLGSSGIYGSLKSTEITSGMQPFTSMLSMESQSSALEDPQQLDKSLTSHFELPRDAGRTCQPSIDRHTIRRLHQRVDDIYVNQRLALQAYTSAIDSLIEKANRIQEAKTRHWSGSSSSAKRIITST